PQDVYLLGISREFFHLALMDLFGLLEVQYPSGEVPSWSPTAVHHTPFGDAVFTQLASRYLGSGEAYFPEDEDTPVGTVRFGRWQPYLRPYFPEWRENLEPPGVEAHEGVFIFKVSLGGRVWRKLAVPSESTLDDLVYAILRSVHFDSDHLYEFT